MGMPRDKDAKRFYLAAGRRLEDSKSLFEAERTTGSMYLGGYCVECMLKSLIITQAPSSKKGEVLEEFRGSGAHNLDRLRSMYTKSGGTRFPKDIIESFLVVRDWRTDWRYEPATRPADDAESFLIAVTKIWECVDKRL